MKINAQISFCFFSAPHTPEVLTAVKRMKDESAGNDQLHLLIQPFST